MAKDVITVALPGHSIPAAFQELVLKECPHALTIAKNEGGKMEVIRVDSNEYELPESLAETLKQDKDKTLVIFHSADEELPEEHQPIPLIETASGPELLGFAAGACEYYVSDTAELRPPVQMMMDWFCERVSVLYAESGRDLKKLITKLETNTFLEELAPHLDPSGVIVLFSKNDTVHFLSRNNAAYGEFPWGHVTNTLGYTEKKPDTTPPGGGVPKPVITIEELEAMAFPKRKKKLEELGFANLEDAKKKLAEQIAASAKAPYVVAASDGTERPDIVQEKGTISFRNGGEVLPPTGAKGNALVKFYEKHLETGSEKFQLKHIKQFLGKPHDERPPIPVKLLAGNSHFLRVLTGADKPDASQSTRKDTQPHHISGVVEGVLAMSPDEVTRAVALRTKAVADGPVTEDQIMAPTKGFVPFTERLGKDEAGLPLVLEEVVVWQDAAFKAIAKDSGSAYALLNEMRLRILRDNPKIMKELSAAASKAAAGTNVGKLPYQQRQAMAMNRQAASK